MLFAPQLHFNSSCMLSGWSTESPAYTFFFPVPLSCVLSDLLGQIWIKKKRNVTGIVYFFKNTSKAVTVPLTAFPTLKLPGVCLRIDKSFEGSNKKGP